jgi:hypothetical protein
MDMGDASGKQANSGEGRNGMDAKANRSEQQLRGKEGTTCFAVSLTPAIIHRKERRGEEWGEKRIVLPDLSLSLGSFASPVKL